ncbi:uncharacterized protein tex15 isoform X2 [Paramormyrops kingsleyae]|uniref:uncharacterized protein tex15 isoform X2 n=1 Tax=Paramormyrops kingsleyae TaxID=1676925 RepID=UPI003B979391
MMKTANRGRGMTHTTLDIAGNSTLKQFVIPKKRRPPGTSLLEPCLTESREYCCILSILTNSRLDQTPDFFLSWECHRVQLVNNEELLGQFLEKRSEMRSRGRQTREMEEWFCFLAVSAKDVEHICQQGLRADGSGKHTLGNPDHGVYLYRHVDVALRSSTNTNLIIFKVIVGKVKRVPPSLGKNSFQDPTIHYDCYISKDPTGPKDTLLQQALGSSVFAFDYNENQELSPRPRQCLPYAVVSVVPIRNTFSAASKSIMTSPAKNPSTEMLLGSAKPLKTCTIAERWGKGQNAAVTFRHLRAPGNTMYGLGCNSSETPSQGDEKSNISDSTSYSALYNGADFLQFAQQYWKCLPQSVRSHNASTAFVDGSFPVDKHTLQFPHPVTSIQELPHVQSSNNEGCNNISLNQDNPNPNFHSSTAGVLSNVHTTVFSSQTIRDPRLFRREQSVIQKTPAGDTQQETNSEYDVMKMHGDKTQRKLGNQNKVAAGFGSEHDKPLENLSHSFSKQNGNEQSSSIDMSKMKLPENIKGGILSVEKVPVKQTRLRLENSSLHDKELQGHKERITKNDGALCYAQSHTEVSATRSETGPKNHTQIVVLEKSSDYTCPEMGQQRTIPVSSANANVSDQIKHSHAVTSLKPDVNRPKLQCNTSESVKSTSMDDIHDCSSQFKVNKVDKDTKMKQEEGKSEACEENDDENKQELDTVRLMNTKNIPLQIEQKCYTDKWNCNFEQLGDNSEMQYTCEQCSDIGETQGKTGSRLTELTADIKPPSGTANPNGESLHNFTRLTHPIRLGISGDPENNKCKKHSSQNSDVIPKEGSTLRVEARKASSSPNAVETSEEKFLFSPDFLSNEGVERRPTQTANIRNGNTVYGNNENLLNDSPCIENPKHEQGKTDSSQSSSIYNKVTCNTQKAQSNYNEPQESDMLLCILHKRMQFSQMSLASNAKEEILVSDKPYLRPIILKNYQDNLLSPLQNKCPTKNNLQITIKNCENIICSEPEVLSRKFPLISYQKNRNNFSGFDDKSINNCIATTAVNNKQENLQDFQFTENTEQALNTIFTYVPEVQSKNGHNVELVKKMAEKYWRKLSFRHKRKNKTTTYKPIDKNLHSYTSAFTNSPGNQSNVKGCTTQLPQENDECSLYVSTKEAARTSRSITSPAEMVDDTMIQQISPDNTSCSMKQSKEFNIGDGNSLSNAAVKKHNVSSPRSTEPCVSSECMKSSWHVRRTSSGGKVKKTKPLGDLSGSRERGCKSRLCQRVKTRKLLMYYTNGVCSVYGWPKRNLHREKTFRRVHHWRRGQSKRLIKSVLLKRNKKAEKINNKRMPLKENEDNDRVGDDLLTTEADYEKCCDGNGSEIIRPLDMVPEELEECLTFKVVCSSPLDTDIGSQNYEEQICDVDGTQTVPMHSTSEEALLPNSTVQEQNEVHVRSDESRDHMSNKTSQRESISETFAIAAFTTGDTNKMKNDSYDFLGELPEESQKEIHFLETMESTQDDTTAHPMDNLISSEPQVNMVPNLQNVADVNTINIMQKYNSSPLQDQKDDSNISSRVILINKLKNFLKGVRFQKRGINKPIILNKRTKKTRQKTCKNMQAIVQTPAQSMKLDGRLGEENSVWNPQGNLHTSIARQENCGKNIANPNQWVSAKGKSKENTGERHDTEPIFNTTSIERKHRVNDISNMLKEADVATSIDKLISLRSRCEEMLQYFISTFESDQNVNFNEAIVSRDLIVDRYPNRPPKPVHLKYEALNSFFELQMMMEAKQFVENKIRFLHGEPTFRSLLWYDTTLYAELCKWKIMRQQQVSIYPFLHGNYSCDGCSRSHHHLYIPNYLEQERSKDSSYYMYLMKRRESMENLTAQEHKLDSENFLHSVPLTCSVNFGDSLEILQVLQKYLKLFRLAHFNPLQETITTELDLHLSILCRLLHRKINYLVRPKVIDNHVSWFGFEHLLYDASKILIWKNQKPVLSLKSLTMSHDAWQQRAAENGAETLSTQKRSLQNGAGTLSTRKRSLQNGAGTLSTRKRSLQNGAGTLSTQKRSLQNGTALVMASSPHGAERNKKRRKSKQCEKVPVAMICLQNTRRPGNPLLMLNEGSEASDHQAKREMSRGPHLPSTGPVVDNNAWCQESVEQEKNIQSAPAWEHREMLKPFPEMIPANPVFATWGERSCDPHIEEWQPSACVSSTKVKTAGLQTHPDMWIHMHNANHKTKPSSEYKTSFLAAGIGGYSPPRGQWSHPWHESVLQNQPATDVWGGWRNVAPHNGGLTYQSHLRSYDFRSSYSLQLPQQFVPLGSSQVPTPHWSSLPFLSTPQPDHLSDPPMVVDPPLLYWNHLTFTSTSPAVTSRALHEIQCKDYLAN